MRRCRLIGVSTGYVPPNVEEGLGLGPKYSFFNKDDYHSCWCFIIILKIVNNFRVEIFNDINRRKIQNCRIILNSTLPPILQGHVQH